MMGADDFSGYLFFGTQRFPCLDDCGLRQQARGMWVLVRGTPGKNSRAKTTNACRTRRTCNVHMETTLLCLSRSFAGTQDIVVLHELLEDAGGW